MPAPCKSTIRNTPAGTIDADGNVYGKFAAVAFAPLECPDRPFRVKRTRQRAAQRLTVEQAREQFPKLSVLAEEHWTAVNVPKKAGRRKKAA
jgi:hypothetical protein